MNYSPGLRAAHLIDRLERISRTTDGGPSLNAVQWQALRYLARANRFSKTPAALADFLTSTRGTVSQTLITLEERGFVRKAASERDRRVVELDLTSAGREALEFDPLLSLGRDLEGAAGRGVEDLVAVLEQTLRSQLQRRGGRAFGACYTCAHFRKDAASDREWPHRCALLDEPLSEADSLAICAEQVG